MFHKATPRLRGLGGLRQGPYGFVQVCPPATNVKSGSNNYPVLFVSGKRGPVVPASGAGPLAYIAASGSPYYSAHDPVLGIEFLAGVSAGSGVFLGSLTNHPLEIRTNNVHRIDITAAGAVTVQAVAATATLTALGSGGLASPAMVGSGTDYQYRTTDSGGAADAKHWAWRAAGNQFVLSTVNDAFAANKNALVIVRSGLSLTSFTFGNTDNPTYNFSGTGLTTFSGSIVVGAPPASTVAAFINNADAAQALELSAAAGYTDARCTIRFTGLKTSTQQYDIGIDTQGSAGKNWEIRDITSSGSPVRLRLTQGGFFVILQPTAVGTALVVNGSTGVGSGASAIFNTGIANQHLILNGIVAGRSILELAVNNVAKAYVGVNSTAGDLIAGSVLNALCFRATNTGMSFSVDAGTSAALDIGANNFTTHRGIVLSAKGNEGFVGAYEYAFMGGL